MMTYNTDADICYVCELWHKAILGRDLDGLMALNAKYAILKSPLNLATVRDKSKRIRGNPEFRSFSQVGLRELQSDLSQWHRTGAFSSSGRLLNREYSRGTPQGNQIDLVEVLDIGNALIVRHGLYWGGVGLKALVVTSDSQAS